MHDAYNSCILICMRTTINLDDELLAKAMQITGVKEKTRLLHMGLEEIVRSEAIRRIVALRGKIKGAKAAPRRRF